VEAFVPNKTQRRVFRRGEAQLQSEMGPPTVTSQKVALYNRHKVERGLLVGDGLVDAESYEQFLGQTCVDTIEITYRHDGALIGVAVVDRAADALSAVYCFYDPDYERFSLEAAVPLPGTVRRRVPRHELQVALCAPRAADRRGVVSV
jgi:arginine-tRNA-protein transferase